MMKHIVIAGKPGFEEWRHHARHCFCHGIAPEDIMWQDQSSHSVDLFAATDNIVTQNVTDGFSVSRQFMDLASLAVCHNSPDRFAVLYRVLWRLKHDNPHLLKLKTDVDVMALHKMVKAVRRDAYKIKAFLRFREINTADGEAFVAWYEPEHYSLALSLPFFQTRFKNMRWSIITPYLAAHWDGNDLTLNDNPDPSVVPNDDTVEKYWLKYYATTFNPARPKKSAMLNQMPKKYWKNMPETALIPDLLRNSQSRVIKMIENSRQD